jgi:hypothetical protein
MKGLKYMTVPFFSLHSKFPLKILHAHNRPDTGRFFYVRRPRHKVQAILDSDNYYSNVWGNTRGVLG